MKSIRSLSALLCLILLFCLFPVPASADTGDWTDVTAVWAGHEFTVGLRRDGMVLVDDFSPDRDEAFDVSDWEDVIDILIGYSYITGLCGDGTVRVTGSERLAEKVSSWRDVTQLCQSSAYLLGLRGDGTVYCASTYSFDDEDEEPDQEDYWESETSSWTGVDRLLLGSYYVYGLTEDNRLLGIPPEYHIRTDHVADISCNADVMMFLYTDGTVALHIPGSYEQESYPVDVWRDITKIEAGDWTYVGLRSDGVLVSCDIMGPSSRLYNWKDVRQFGIVYGALVVALDGEGRVHLGDPGDAWELEETVRDWPGVQELFVGYDYLAALFPDGTMRLVLVDAPEDSFCPDEVAGWTDIVSFAGSHWHFVGLRSDGTVVTALR